MPSSEDDEDEGDPWKRPRRGVWWIPSEPERKVAGILRRDASGGGELTLEDALVVPEPRQGNVDPVPTIHGASATGAEEFLLVDNYETRRENIGSELLGPRTQAFSARYALHHCVTEAVDPSVSSVWCKLDVLDAWCQPATALEERESLEPDGEGGYVTRLTLRWPPPISSLSPVGRISFEYPPDMPGGRWDRVTYRRRAYLKIDLEEDVPLSKLFESVLTPIRSLLHFATGAELTFTQINPSIRGNTAKIRATDLWCRCDPLDADGKRSPMSDDKAEDACRHGFFTLRQINEELPELWDRWFALHSAIRAPLYAVLGAMDYYSGRDLTDRFQSVAFAAEALHRSLEYPAGRGLGKPEAKALRRRIRDVLSPDEGKLTWLDGRITHLTDTPFTSRIEVLVDRSPACLQNAVGDDFAERVARARNEAAHLDDRTLETSPNELHRLYNLLILVQAACIMSELGFPMSKVDGFIRYSDRFYELIRRGAIATHGRSEDETFEARPQD